jgi:hypothetical protein
VCAKGVLGYSVHLFGYGFAREAVALLEKFNKNCQAQGYTQNPHDPTLYCMHTQVNAHASSIEMM